MEAICYEMAVQMVATSLYSVYRGRRNGLHERINYFNLKTADFGGTGPDSQNGWTCFLSSLAPVRIKREIIVRTCIGNYFIIPVDHFANLVGSRGYPTHSAAPDNFKTQSRGLACCVTLWTGAGYTDPRKGESSATAGHT
ncbi:Hypothetical predicted protein [Pelobates cultripes]|uniref:Uncharacterized protein n=1 Tax=Pelobates cultripes TaxID=61616 RepID=A0AAD1RLH7_PELCU|nr:Hypothetical predicted protein [Pelobates cultripes]